MLDDISDIAQFYNSNPDDEQGRLEQHQLEYDLTWRYLQEYLPPRGAILEIGAPHWIEDQEHVRSFIEGGTRPQNSPRGGFRGYFARACEIASLHEALGLHTLVLAGVEPGISADDDSYNRLQGEQRQLWLKLLYEIGQVESTLGASRHLLYTGSVRFCFYAGGARSTIEEHVVSIPGHVPFGHSVSAACAARAMTARVQQFRCLNHTIRS